MKKYLKTAMTFLIVGLLGGVYYREFSKALGMQNRFSVLGSVHVHFLTLGVLAVLLFGLIEDRLKAANKMEKYGFTCYVIGTAGAGAMLLVRGTMEMLAEVGAFTVGKGMNGMLSGLAGLFHIVLSTGFIMLMSAWIKACKE